MPSPTKIIVNVTLTQDQNQTYNWSYQSSYPGFDPKTGKLTFQHAGETDIQYVLQGTDYNLIYVNLDPYVCATREIRNILIEPHNNSITLTDANSPGQTNNTPFSLSLVARVAGDLGAPIVSPDPEVENDPGQHNP